MLRTDLGETTVGGNSSSKPVIIHCCRSVVLQMSQRNQAHAHLFHEKANGVADCLARLGKTSSEHPYIHHL